VNGDCSKYAGRANDPTVITKSKSRATSCLDQKRGSATPRAGYRVINGFKSTLGIILYDYKLRH
jgi:hypothetical protein